MFDHVGWGELVVLAIIGLFVFGPERLPKVVADATRTLRELRRMARSATSELRSELGPEMADLDLRSLHPKRFVRDQIFGDLEDEAQTEPTPVGRRSVPLAAGERPPYDVDAT